MKRLITVLLFIFSSVQYILAQCAMCKAGAETSLEAGNTQAVGINSGVLYILFFVLLFLTFFSLLALKGKKYFE